METGLLVNNPYLAKSKVRIIVRQAFNEKQVYTEISGIALDNWARDGQDQVWSGYMLFSPEAMFIGTKFQGMSTEEAIRNGALLDLEKNWKRMEMPELKNKV